MVENKRETTPSIESLFPNDVLPTGRFLSALPGFDKEYSKVWPAKDISTWDGKTTINDDEVIIRIGHVHKDTIILIDKNLGKEEWEIDEGYEDCLILRLKRAHVPFSVFLPKATTEIVPPFRSSNFLAEIHMPYKDRLYLRGNIEKPSDRPMITEDMIDVEKIRSYGIEFSPEWIFEMFRALKQAIAEAEPVEYLEDPSPNPSPNSPISEEYFPR